MSDRKVIDPTAIGARIRLLRQNSDMTAMALAARIGVTKGFMSQLESGFSKPGMETLIHLADALDVTTDFLLGREKGREQ